MTQLQLPLDPPTRHRPTFLAESNKTLLAIAGQERRRAESRRQALAVLSWRSTLSKGGAMGRPSRAQLVAAARLLERLDDEVDR